MESKLPKPSGLNRPKHTGQALGSSSDNGVSSSVDSLKLLTPDSTNLTSGILHRAQLPDLHQRKGNNNSIVIRGKLRRSRSASDLCILQPIKRPHLTPPKISAKTSRLATRTASNASVGASTFTAKSAVALPARIGSVNTTSSSKSAQVQSPALSQRKDDNNSVVTRGKLRRSRSASDLRTVQQKMKPYLIKSQISAKTSGLATRTASNASVGASTFTARSDVSQPARIGSVNTTSSSKSAQVQSPDLSQRKDDNNSVVARGKLRRSRSASDLRTVQQKMKPHLIKSQISAKTSRLATRTASNPSVGASTITSKSAVSLPARIGSVNTTSSSKSAQVQSPDLSQRKDDNNSVVTRGKLRRSRSASDLRTVQQKMKPHLIKSQISAKTSGLATRTALNASVIASTFTRKNAVSQPARICSVNRTSSSKSAQAQSANLSQRKDGINSVVNSFGVGVSSVKSRAIGANKTVSVSKEKYAAAAGSNSCAGKSINKRIAPHDFKGRYNDLLKEYNTLKEKYDQKCEQAASLEAMADQFKETQNKLSKVGERFEEVETERENLISKMEALTLEFNTISDSLVCAGTDLAKATTDYNTLKEEHSSIKDENINLRENVERLTQKKNLLLKDKELFKEQLFIAHMERQKLHNNIMDLRGSIRVFCRVRPPLDFEQHRRLCDWSSNDECCIEIKNPDLKQKKQNTTHVFNFDHVFLPTSTQEDIFEMVSPLIQSALDGYNVCIFAYGQTGSGKTYTMHGNSSQAGVIPRVVDFLFNSLNNYERMGWQYELKVTCVEIYNETLYDLLGNDHKEVEIRMAKDSKQHIYVSNITEETVLTASRLHELMQVANMNRTTALTAGNECSSRSHAVTIIKLTVQNADKNENYVGTINFVDLAGSESPKTSEHLTETKHITHSLLELTNVILALLQKQEDIPYGNSKLTHLLMPSLGGNSKTVIFINVAPFVDCFEESVKSLRFAAAVNSCKVGKAKRNHVLNT